MKTATNVLGTAFLMAAGLVGLSLALSHDRAERELTREGYKDIDIVHTGLAYKQHYLFENAFSATSPQGQRINGELLQDRFGKHFKVL